MRTSEWVARLNLSVKPCESRPDAPAGAIVYRVKDIFTARDGLWEPSVDDRRALHSEIGPLLRKQP
jgi:hypothetical protein